MMSRAQGDLSILTIVLIFAFVFGAMFQAWESYQNPGLPQDTADADEKVVRETVLRMVNDWRGENNRFPTPTTGEDILEAQQTAELIPRDGTFTGPRISGSGYESGPDLPNPGPKCTQMAVAIPLSADEVTDDGLTEAAVDRVGAEAVEGFKSVDESGILTRRVWATSGVGVEIQNQTAYVVYRSCITDRYSP